MTAFLALVRKELLLFSRDRRALIMSFVAPIVIASFFAFVFGRTGGPVGDSRVTLALVDEDHSAVSDGIAKKMADSKDVDLKRMDRAGAESAVRAGKIAVAAVIPAGFGEQASKAFFRRDLAKPEIEVLYDPARAMERQMVEGILTGHVMEAVGAEVFNADRGMALLESALKDVEKSTTVPSSLRTGLSSILAGVRELPEDSKEGGQGFGGMTVPFTTKAHAAAENVRQDWDGAGHYFGGMGVQFILFLGIETGVSLLLQKQRGLWKRFRCAPVPRSVLLASKAASSAICAFAILVAMFLFARAVFGVPLQGSFAGFALIGIAFALMTSGYGLLIAALGKTPEGARPISVLATLFLVMLGGSWMPTFLFPAWLQQATLIVPTRWAVDGLDAMTWRGMGFQAALLPAAVILGFAVLFLAVAWSRFEWDA